MSSSETRPTSPEPRRRAVYAGVTLVALVLVLVAGLAAFRIFGLSMAGEDDPYSRPGSLVRLPDGRRLNLACMGHGAPTVVLESGYGANARAWAHVQPIVARTTRVCSYDRAGYGFSDPGPPPRDGAAIARDLDFGLKAAGVSGPYVVVGHSAGGLYARLFAARRIKDVVGLVFVDSSVEHQTQRMEAIFGAGAGSLEGQQRRALRCLSLTADRSTPAGSAGLLECAPAKLDAHSRKVALRPDYWRTQLSELDNLFTTTSDEVDRVGNLLQDIPAIVLTAGKADGVPATRDDPGAMAWQAMHRQLAQRFLHGEARNVKSSHLMMNDRPEVVTAAILELVTTARKR
ncbi:MAG TPA: alpha/beta hydrolase [Phenylobacterium sp.]|jgi:pimeloyl-ACP methyl ester carboxylesterase|uniref:alpha/beta fold hydrolase n=1 Tax=Phenylobacterium sp. TaxID=1871053 RepID=UPI002D299E5D|nr:alpha/beta hydrolase [Phenylobacterium sp.]HZZ69890.1 alpha/beta hydrolase [Phenylobacterium sp.]